MNDGEPAFPVSHVAGPGDCWCNEGMTLRDLFAGFALVGYLAAGQGANCCLTEFCYARADEMIAQRSEEAEL